MLAAVLNRKIPAPRRIENQNRRARLKASSGGGRRVYNMEDFSVLFRHVHKGQAVKGPPVTGLAAPFGVENRFVQKKSDLFALRADFRYHGVKRRRGTIFVIKAFCRHGDSMISNRRRSKEGNPDYAIILRIR
jgi:hypothetical protein